MELGKQMLLGMGGEMKPKKEPKCKQCGLTKKLAKGVECYGDYIEYKRHKWGGKK